jgi:hypothetical protein
MNESLYRSLAELPQAESEQARSDRLRARCHTMLAKQRARAAAPRTVRRLWEPVVVGMGCLYVAGVIREAMQVYARW